MNILDLIIVILLAMFVLSGIYRGFINSALSVIAAIISWASGMIFMPLLAKTVTGNASVFNTLLYYSEGSEFIGDAEIAKQSIDSFTSSQIQTIVDNAKLPFPFAKEITENIAKQSFESMNITSLGDYFNQTIVCVIINILSFLVIFAISYCIMKFVINGVDYSVRFPKLARFEVPVAAGFGFIRGLIWVFVIFMLVPLILVAVNFDFIHALLDNSFFAPFFYHMSFLLGMMPGV